MDRVVLFRVGWMKYYDGITENDRIYGGGKFVDENECCLEINNFHEYSDFLFRGYVQPVISRDSDPFLSTININRIIGDDYHDGYADGVTVVWIAKNPKDNRTKIVGWYKNATVFREFQYLEDDNLDEYWDIPLGYYAIAYPEDCTLLCEVERNFIIPSAKHKKGGMGKSNVRYLDQDNTEKLKNRIVRYINSFEHYAFP